VSVYLPVQNSVFHFKNNNLFKFGIWEGGFCTESCHENLIDFMKFLII
jgi:hypothetical protein